MRSQLDLADMIEDATQPHFLRDIMLDRADRALIIAALRASPPASPAGGERETPYFRAWLEVIEQCNKLKEENYALRNAVTAAPAQSNGDRVYAVGGDGTFDESDETPEERAQSNGDEVKWVKDVVDLYFAPWGAAKAARFEAMTGDAPFDPEVVLKLIRDKLAAKDASL